MLHTRKRTEDYNALAEQVINYAQRSGYEDIKADFEGYNSPASLKMLKEGITLTPDFTARRGSSKHYFELVVKNPDEDQQSTLISKWKALEVFAKMKGGSLNLFVPRGSYKFAAELVQEHSIDANMIKLSDIKA
ncbi:hypothetical protein [Cesiribacter sp. SM1]|uniref:hypothetical protein n=1 Tax=Cesiribacter sp. SM1 TaxID=2861196 RepID=UPI001CD7EAEA|nr:hypothetical protein [Cesiribacter sp. SM1]